MTSAQPWLLSARADGFFILATPLAASAIALLLHAAGYDGEVSPMAWLVLVVGIDVAHVYATLFRTYFDREELERRPALYILTPLCAWVVGALLYQTDALLFWRALAYLAVFHFVRQQYGFARIYGRNETPSARRLTGLAVYAAAIYPLIYWHTHLPRTFHWFVEGDFAALPSAIEPTARRLYLGILAVYALREAGEYNRGRFNLAKNLVVLGTAISWYVGIVWLNADLSFTLTNVVAHGVPYFALVWIHGHREIRLAKAARSTAKSAFFRSVAAVPIFVLLLVWIAYAEESLWDALVWREHSGFFPAIRWLPQPDDDLLAAIVPLLAVPQITHYVVDGFIWRMRRSHEPWAASLGLINRRAELRSPVRVEG